MGPDNSLQDASLSDERLSAKKDLYSLSSFESIILHQKNARFYLIRSIQKKND